MNFNLQNSIQLIIIFLLGFVVLYKCEKDPYSEKDTQRYIDTTVFIKTHYDTNYFDSVRVRTLTKYNHVNIYDQEDSSKVYRYVTDINDSLISGSIVTGLKIKDTNVTLLAQYIDYTPKFPKYIYRTDSVFTTIKDCTIVYDNKLKLLIGGNIDLGTKTTLTPIIGVQLKNKTYIEAGYNFFNKSILVGAKFKLF